MPRPTRALIDLEALRANYRHAANLAGSARAMAVVKADGYGHGLEPVARALADSAPEFAVACLEEALRIRQSGVSQSVVLLEGVHESADYATCIDNGFEAVIHSDHQIDWLEASQPDRLKIWLKVNTGMNRLGFTPAVVPSRIERLERVGAGLVGLMTHLACGDDVSSSMTAAQMAPMAAFKQQYPSLAVSVANSAGHFQQAGTQFDWTRPGIMLYGSAPLNDQTQEQAGVRPVMHLRSQLIAVRELAAGEQVGYGGSWTADKRCRMGVVAIGYGDGYPRHAPSGTPVWVGGVRVPLIGRVSMDMITVDLTGVDHAQVGDEVELWGGRVSVDEVARCAGTISYELLTGVTARVPRYYLQGL